LVSTEWKVGKAAELIGIPRLDTEYLPPAAIVQMKHHLQDVEGLGAVIMFGSIVRGEGSPKSDIDLMLVPTPGTDGDALWHEVLELLIGIETEFDLPVSFSTIVFEGDEDSHFLWEVARDGVVIFCRPGMVMAPKEGLTPYALISYTYNGLGDNGKRRVQRFLFDNDNGLNLNKSNRLEYVSRGVILLSMERAELATGFFDLLNVKYGLKKVWI